MRSRSLVAVVWLSGCTPSTPPSSSPPAATPPAGAERAAGAEPAARAEGAGVAPEAAPMAPERRALMWSARSDNGRAEVRQVPWAEGDRRGCVSRATLRPEDAEKPPEVVWEWRTCLGSAEQLQFVSPDGQRVLVIDPAPALPRGPWMGVELASLYAHGVRMRVLKAQSVWGMPRVESTPAPHLVWMKGHGTEPGTPARYVSDGQAVAFETLEGRAWTLAFSGEGFPAGSEEASAFTEREHLLRYQDAQGTVHIVRSLDEVPRRFRDRATPVTAEVDVRKSPKPPPPAVAEKDREKDKTPPAASDPSTPADLIERAEQAARKVEAVRREQERMLRTPP
jgi:hypothetical protein